ncbi:MAG: ATP-dependent Clp protease adaptor ClpS [Thermoguttaceae bacterium]
MSDSFEATAEVPLTETVQRRHEQRKARPKRQPRYHVILWNDEQHTYEYVILMLRALFGHEPAKGFQLAKQVDSEGRAVVLTTTQEHAELKRDQVHAYGKDLEIDECQGSMWATIEAEGGE